MLDDVTRRDIRDRRNSNFSDFALVFFRDLSNPWLCESEALSLVFGFEHYPISWGPHRFSTTTRIPSAAVVLLWIR